MHQRERALRQRIDASIRDRPGPGGSAVLELVIHPLQRVAIAILDRAPALSQQAMKELRMKKVMADPRVKPDVNPMPFDGQRLIYGGFEPIVEA